MSTTQAQNLIENYPSVPLGTCTSRKSNITIVKHVTSFYLELEPNPNGTVEYRCIISTWHETSPTS